MNNKKIINISKYFGLLLLILVIFTSYISLSYLAKYVSTGDSYSDARVANFDVLVSLSEDREFVLNPQEGILTDSVDITLTNKSEVSIGYSIEFLVVEDLNSDIQINWFSDLKLDSKEPTILYNGNAVLDEVYNKNKYNSVSYIFDGFEIGVGDENINTHTLKISVPDVNKEVLDIFNGDLKNDNIKIIVHVEQKD